MMTFRFFLFEERFFFCGDVLGLSWTRSIVPNYQSFSFEMLVKGAVLALDFPADGCFAVSVVDHGAYKVLVFVKLVPGVCPSRFPSEFHSKRFFLASASFVRCEIRLLSISEASEKANAMT